MEFKEILIYAAMILSFFAILFSLIQEDESITTINSIYIYNSTNNSFSVPIALSNTYYTLNGGMYNVTVGTALVLDRGVVLVERAGYYNINWDLGFGGANNAKYKFTIGHNSQPLDACTSFRGTTSNIAHSVAGNCVVYVNAGDNLTFMYSDVTNPPTDLEFYSLNAIITEVIINIGT